METIKINPVTFEMTYTISDGEENFIIVIHRGKELIVEVDIGSP